jgi:hypothetical protein
MWYYLHKYTSNINNEKCMSSWNWKKKTILMIKVIQLRKTWNRYWSANHCQALNDFHWKNLVFRWFRCHISKEELKKKYFNLHTKNLQSTKMSVIEYDRELIHSGSGKHYTTQNIFTFFRKHVRINKLDGLITKMTVRHLYQASYPFVLLLHFFVCKMCMIVHTTITQF